MTKGQKRTHYSRLTLFIWKLIAGNDPELLRKRPLRDPGDVHPRRQPNSIACPKRVFLTTLRLRHVYFSLQKKYRLIAKRPGIRCSQRSIRGDVRPSDPLARAPDAAQHGAGRPAVPDKVELPRHLLPFLGLGEVVVGPVRWVVADVVDPYGGGRVHRRLAPVPDAPPLLEEGRVDLPPDLEVLGRADDGPGADGVFHAGGHHRQGGRAVDDARGLVAQGCRVGALVGAIGVGPRRGGAHPPEAGG